MRTKKAEVNNSTSQIRRGAIMSYATTFFNIITGLLYTPWMINEIGKSDYGLYTLAISVISFFAMDFGLGPAVSRFLSIHKANQDDKSESEFLGLTFKLFIGITTIIFIVLATIYLLIENIYVQLNPVEIEKLKVVFLISSLFTVVTFPFKPFDGILIANERFYFIKLIGLLHKVFTVLLIIIALIFKKGLYTVVFINALAGILKVILQYIYIKRHTKTRVNFKYNNTKILKSVAKFSIWTTIISISQRLLINITPSILAALSGSVQITLFSIGKAIEGYTWTFSHALGGMFVPRVARIYKSDNSEIEIERLLIKVGRIQLFIVGLILAGFVSMGKEFMILWMGDSFIESYYIALFLILPGIVTLTQEVAYSALVALNEIRYRAIGTIITSLISLILSIILSKSYGAVGASFSIFIGNIIGLVVFMNIIYHKVIKINIKKFFLECHLNMLPSILFSTIIGFMIQIIFPTSSILIFIIKAFILGIVYFTSMWLLTLNNYEKNLFIGLLKK